SGDDLSPLPAEGSPQALRQRGRPRGGLVPLSGRRAGPGTPDRPRGADGEVGPAPAGRGRFANGQLSGCPRARGRGRAVSNPSEPGATGLGTSSRGEPSAPGALASPPRGKVPGRGRLVYGAGLVCRGPPPGAGEPGPRGDAPRPHRGGPAAESAA